MSPTHESVVNACTRRNGRRENHVRLSTNTVMEDDYDNTIYLVLIFLVFRVVLYFKVFSSHLHLLLNHENCPDRRTEL